MLFERGIGICVDFEDDEGVAAALLQLLEMPRGAWDGRFEAAGNALTWRRAAAPLIEFCRAPHRAADKMANGNTSGNIYHLRELELSAHREQEWSHREQEWTEERDRLEVERDHWRNLARRYEQGRFMRLMRGLHQLTQPVRRIGL